MIKDKKSTTYSSLNASNTSNWNEMACIKGCINNSLQSQEQLYKHFYGTMMAIVNRYTTDSHHATTILNNGFLKVFKNIQQFKYEGSFEGWIKKIIIRSVADFFRERKTISTFEISDYDSKNETLSTNAFTIPFDYNLLLKILQQLPSTTRVVINLFLIEGHTHKQIARQLNISENTSKWHVANGKKILVNLLNKQQYEY